MSINFKSVHAKIKQVDSHATLGEGIVIQVTGELSVNGQPMRAFVQTFVLAPESPKKYYVHNDIFRYQDDAYDITSESENNEGMTEREQDVVQVMMSLYVIYSIIQPFYIGIVYESIKCGLVSCILTLAHMHGSRQLLYLLISGSLYNHL